jgi:putative oxygen-independent coproporphyrinogen III oxidase
MQSDSENQKIKISSSAAITPLVKRTDKAGLYIHFPYCIHKCGYCDFFSEGIGKSTNINQNEIFTIFKKELSIRIEDDPSLLDLEFRSIFFGGGTPSLVDLEEFESFLEYLRTTLKFKSSLEITLEANPEDITTAFLHQINDLGVNRINVGIQSFQEQHLKMLDRFYDPSKYSKIMQILHDSPIERFGIDLIYGIPGQTREEFLKDIEHALEYPLKHLSCYALTLEKGTNYSREVSENKKLPPNEELQADLLKELPSILAHYGLKQYEVSNYAIPGYECRHNMGYWAMDYYLSLGPGAHGWIPKGRYSNQRNIYQYLRNQFSGKYDKIEPNSEIPINVFRLFYPFNIYSYFSDNSEILEITKNLLSSWRDKKICDFDSTSGVFQWRPQAVVNLDGYITEYASAIDKK